MCRRMDWYSVRNRSEETHSYACAGFYLGMSINRDQHDRVLSTMKI